MHHQFHRHYQDVTVRFEGVFVSAGVMTAEPNSQLAQLENLISYPQF